eukprot:4237623-Pyramimonas_sp.AAC.1
MDCRQSLRPSSPCGIVWEVLDFFMAPPGLASSVREIRRSKASTLKPHWVAQLDSRDRCAIPEVPVLVSPKSFPRARSEVPHGPPGPPL